jgi:hypothetical protein
MCGVVSQQRFEPRALALKARVWVPLATAPSGVVPIEGSTNLDGG